MPRPTWRWRRAAAPARCASWSAARWGATSCRRRSRCWSADSPAKLARKHAIDLRRARTLLAGAVILAEVQARLGVPFEVARGGLREGLAGQLLSELQAA